MINSLKISNLTKNFGDICAVKDISFSTSIGEVIALLGPNGAGKSTLMNMITGYLSPNSGTIEVMGLDCLKNSVICKEKIGFLPEGSPLYPDMSVLQLLSYIAELKGIYGKEKKEKILEIAKKINITEILNQKIETLSKGYLRRVGFAQSILSDAPILLLDEPTDGLDPNQKKDMRNLISSLGKNKTIIISTHLLEEAETIANRIILINKGQIIIDGTSDDILSLSKSSNLSEAFYKLTNGEKTDE